MRLPRKIKKIAKSCIDYGSTESYIRAWGASERDKKLPNFGIVFLLTKSKWLKIKTLICNTC